MGEHLELAIVTGDGLTVTVAVVASTEPPPVTDNEFVPERRDLSECITALPKPDCGSAAKSDWHQGLVLGVMIAGLIVIGWRIVRGVRQREAAAKDIDASST